MPSSDSPTADLERERRRAAFRARARAAASKALDRFIEDLYSEVMATAEPAYMLVTHYLAAGMLTACGLPAGTLLRSDVWDNVSCRACIAPAVPFGRARLQHLGDDLMLPVCGYRSGPEETIYVAPTVATVNCASCLSHRPESQLHHNGHYGVKPGGPPCTCSEASDMGHDADCPRNGWARGAHDV